MSINEFDLESGRLRLSVNNQEQYLEALITRLQTGLPGTTRVVRGFSLFSKKKPLKFLEVVLGNQAFKLEFSKSGGIQTSIGTAVRGIVLKTESIDFKEWLHKLSASIVGSASVQVETDQLLEDFLL